jgi:hypothetical protein
MNKIFGLIVVLLFLMQGCSSVVQIKIPKIPEIAHCVQDTDSQGRCTPPTEGKTFFVSYSSYLDALGTVRLPEKINEESFVTSEGNSCVRIYNKEAAQIAMNAFRSDTNKNILLLMQSSGSSTVSPETTTVEFDINNFNTFLKDMAEADIYGGIESLQCAIQHNNRLKNNNDLNVLNHVSKYVKTYFKAYFRQGKFIQGKLKVSELYTMLKNKIREEAQFLTDDLVTDAANKLFKLLSGKEYANACPDGKQECSIVFWGKLEAAQFVTRAGVEYGFPNITVSVDPFAEKKMSVEKIDWNKVGAEIVKVYIEAVGDALIRLPADPRSTACKMNEDLCFSKKDPKESPWKCEKPIERIPAGCITDEEFSSVAEYSNKVDTLFSSIVGKAIRGGWWMSLNNEAVARFIESAVGTASKKFAEKVAYCIYSCKDPKKPDAPKSELGEVTIKVRR